MSLEWLVIRTHFAKEKPTKLSLEADGYETILPLARIERRRKNGLLVSHLTPLFPSYMFIKAEIEGRVWEKLLYQQGIKEFLGYRDGMVHPLTVREKEIQELRARIAQDGGAVPIGLSRPKYFPPETLVHVLFGPFRDLNAIVQADKGSRIEVLIRLFGRESKTELPRDCLAVAV